MPISLKKPREILIFFLKSHQGPSTYDIRFFGAIFDLPTYPYPILAQCKVYFRLVISDFHKPTYLPKYRTSYVDGPLLLIFQLPCTAVCIIVFNCRHAIYITISNFTSMCPSSYPSVCGSPYVFFHVNRSCGLINWLRRTQKAGTSELLYNSGFDTPHKLVLAF